MAYSTNNPPSALTPRVGGGFCLWHYDSPDAKATIGAAGYITNGADLGMEKGDMVLQTDSVANASATIFTVADVLANGSASLSTGTTIA